LHFTNILPQEPSLIDNLSFK